MTVFKCKMCGGEIEFEPGASIGVCAHCGTRQTLPRLDDDRRANLYDRANHFRRNNEFDKAAGLYEQILNEDRTDAEAYWSLVLCRYGIEYVEDPKTHYRVPTVNRTQFTSVFDDEDYREALQYADTEQRRIYEAEAAAINEIQKGILAISQKEEPFDVFICYKEADNSGHRTPDSVLANDLYHHLTQEGFKVFFSRITLEDKLGVAYEPYIFAALNSAKVMVVLGTKAENFNAAWVKNEWSRYLSLVERSGGKKILIPAYRDMDPYDLPEEFSHLMAQDMSKLGFMQDLIRGVKKIIRADEPKATAKETPTVENSANIEPLLRRAFMFLEDGDFPNADAYCERVLDQDPENAQAYLGKLMAELNVCRQESLANCESPFDTRNSYQKVLRFGDDKLSSTLRGYINQINERNDRNRKDAIYEKAHRQMSVGSVSSLESARRDFQTIPGWKDADEQTQICIRKIEEIKEQSRADSERTKKAIKKKLPAIAIIIALCSSFAVLFVTILLPNIKNSNQYNEAVALMERGSYHQALEKLNELGDYKDSQALAKEATYQKALSIIENKYYDTAYEVLNEIKGYKDVDSLLEHFYYIPCEITYYPNYSSVSTTYIYEYSEQGLMTQSMPQYANLYDDKDIIKYDSNGVLTKYVDHHGNTHLFEYGQETITETATRSSGEVYMQRVYDQFGNKVISNAMSDNDYSSKKQSLSLDAHNNIVSNSVSNSYDDDGNLIGVNVDVGNLHVHSSFKYEWIYIENAPENYLDVIWRNVRLSHGVEVWHN